MWKAQYSLCGRPSTGCTDPSTFRKVQFSNHRWSLRFLEVPLYGLCETCKAHFWSCHWAQGKLMVCLLISLEGWGGGGPSPSTGFQAKGLSVGLTRILARTGLGLTCAFLRTRLPRLHALLASAFILRRRQPRTFPLCRILWR
jgi:hypothetical protein